MPFGVFGGIAFIGFVLSFGIRSESSETERPDEEASTEGHENGDGRSRRLLR